MEIILLEKVRNLGDIGEKINAKPGYARNYLIPQGKALAATKENLIAFEAKRAEIEKIAAEYLMKAKERAKKLENLVLNITAEVSEDGELFGSVGMREIITALAGLGYEIPRHEISLPNGPIHHIGEHEVNLLIHSELTVPIKVIVSAE